MLPEIDTVERAALSDIDDEDDPKLTVCPAYDDVSEDEAPPPRPSPSAGPPGPRPPPPPPWAKYKWSFPQGRTFSARMAWEGEDLPTPAPHLNHLTAFSQPHEFFQAVDAPEAEYQQRADNSNVYRTWRALYDMDGKGVVCYEGAASIQYADMRYMDAAVLLHGLDPAVSRRKQFVVDTLAVKGHRVGDLFDEKRYKFVRKFHHPNDPRLPEADKKQSVYDNLHQVAPMLATLAQCCRENATPGKRKSTDEETIGFQGASASLKQNCGKYKQAGDGLQADTVCLEGGWMQAFCFRGHSRGPSVTIKGSPKKLSPLHQRSSRP